MFAFVRSLTGQIGTNFQSMFDEATSINNTSTKIRRMLRRNSRNSKKHQEHHTSRVSSIKNGVSGYICVDPLELYFPETPADQMKLPTTIRKERLSHDYFGNKIYKRTTGYLFPVLFWTRSPIIRLCEVCFIFKGLLFSGLSDPAINNLP